MGLFDGTDTMNAPQGYRMKRLEVYNWGTFDGAVWPFEVGSETSLLTGEIGSGKSTLVDAILTLLISQQKINYNKAADSGSRERTLNSYVRGYYAKRSNADGEEEPVALRDKNQYSVILGVFYDAISESAVSLAQVFYFTPGSDRPTRFFVVGEGDMSIRRDFGNFGTNITDLKKKLKRIPYAHLYNDYGEYAGKFKSLFGITQDNALDLFQQTVSMKKVNGITDFVRRNMLGEVDMGTMEENIQHLLSRFHDLKSIHDAIIRDREKMEILEPLVKASDDYDTCLTKESELTLMAEGLGAYLSREEIKILTEELEKCHRRMGDLDSRLRALGEEAGHLSEEIDNKKKEMWENGGARLDGAKKDLAAYEKDLRLVSKNAEAYQLQAESIGLTLPSTLDEFIKGRQQISGLAADFHKEYDRLDGEKSEADSRERDIVAKIAQDRQELESLKKRDSNIPERFVAVRKQMARDLMVPEKDMPFAGEIMEVKPSEQKWEGALERLLSEFGVSLLVPESLYEKVIGWMENHFLHQRIVYYRVDEYTRPVSMGDLPEKSAARKLNIKKDSPYASWLASELYHRFDHICAETAAEFRKASFALSPEGQIKAQGKWHKKDDRYRIDDRRHYVLGFSNKEKIVLISKELDELARDKAKAEEMIRNLKKQRDLYIAKLNAAESLLKVDNFKDIDRTSFEDRVNRQKQLIRSLTGSDNILARLEKEIQKLNKDLEDTREAMSTIRGEKGGLDNEIRRHEEKKKADESTLAGASDLIRTKAFPLLEGITPAVIGKKGMFTLGTMTEKNNSFNKWIRDHRAANDADKEKASADMATGMTHYLQYLTLHNESDPNLTAELNGANRNEYKEIFRRIREDDLPKLLPKFKKRLRENTIQDMAIFQSKLFSARDRIREKIEEINRSLYDIDYNVGHYIEIECVETLNNEIRQFRQQLKKCTDSSLSGSEDQYNEEKFLEIEKILDRFSASRPGMAEEDRKWTSLVTDVRNWFTFAVSERIRKSDGSRGEEFEHYTDSSGKSGGQKEKLAYTILAASFVYSFGIAGGGRLPTFRFTVIDEAFLKSSDESARFGLSLFRRMGLQLLVVTPLAKIPTIEPFISNLGYVSQNEKRQSELRNMTIGEYRKEFLEREKRAERQVAEG
ncbi:ATP-binding protein [Dialister sp.]|jgi:uncharacterized protein YPO0396|uniref:ATP-binding protein n=1 Tax=Dialister sp. TaxID=1955814 RepID=UPI003A5BD9C4